MINTQYLAISAIFITGFYLGLKVSNSLYKFRVYLKENFDVKF